MTSTPKCGKCSCCETVMIVNGHCDFSKVKCPACDMSGCKVGKMEIVKLEAIKEMIEEIFEEEDDDEEEG